jgi:hypothetical protein
MSLQPAYREGVFMFPWARGGLGPPRPRDRTGRDRRSRGQKIDNDHGRESHGRSRDHCGDRRHRPVQEPAEAGKLLRLNPRVRQSGLGAAHHALDREQHCTCG